ncbi:MAG: TIGR01440 family protein [Symbiobacteriaceae bacterium]|nr:TIGR01440 family protein [Symbiobacteriaceae bacterium]
MELNLSLLATQAGEALQELSERAKLPSGSLVVVGCSTSEVKGEHIGSAGSPDIAAAIFAGLQATANLHGLQLALQCCEHLNRALVVTSEVAREYRLDTVSVIPVPHAGGSMAAHAFATLPRAVVVESLQSQAIAGLDFGATLIGMHLRPVVVPVRLTNRSIGRASLQGAYSRPKLIGGERAVYR